MLLGSFDSGLGSSLGLKPSDALVLGGPRRGLGARRGDALELGLAALERRGAGRVELVADGGERVLLVARERRAEVARRGRELRVAARAVSPPPCVPS